MSRLTWCAHSSRPAAVGLIVRAWHPYRKNLEWIGFCSLCGFCASDPPALISRSENDYNVVIFAPRDESVDLVRSFLASSSSWLNRQGLAPVPEKSGMDWFLFLVRLLCKRPASTHLAERE